MTNLLRTPNPTQFCSQPLHHITASRVNNESRYAGQYYFQQGPSLTEATISRYNESKEGYNNNIPQVKTRRHQDTGRLYP